MKAVIIHKPQNLGNVKVRDVVTPNVLEYEVLVNIKAVGVNYADLLSVQGLYNWNPNPPYILGLESAGEVVKVGSKVSKFKIGDKVVIGSKGGNYAEFIAKHEDWVLKMPDWLDFNQAASLCGNWTTAWTALFEMARVRPNERILIHSAAGGVGLAAIALGKAYGLNIFGTTSSVSKTDYLESLGINVLTYDNFYEYFLNNQKPNFILESIGGKVHKQSLEILAPLGRIVTIGASSIKVNRLNPFSWYKAWKDLPRISHDDLHSQAYMTLHMGHLLENNREVVEPIWDSMIKFMKEHNLQPEIRQDHIFPMSKVNEAHMLMENRKNIGKIILIPNL